MNEAVEGWRHRPELSALENASSIAGLLLTTEAVISEIKEPAATGLKIVVMRWRTSNQVG